MTVVISVAVGVFLLSLWRPVYGLGAVMLLWPAYLLRTTVAGIPTTALELSIYGLTLAAAIRWVRSPRPWPPLPRWLLLWGGVFVVAWVAATTVSPNLRDGLGALKAWLIDPLLLSAVMLFAVQSETDHRWLLKAATVSGTIVALAGVVQLAWFRSTLQDNRLSSFFHPVANYAAMFLVPLIVLAAAAIIEGQLPRRWWLAVGSMTLALVLTVSFGGYLALAAGAAVLWWWVPRRALRRSLAIVGVAVAVAGTLVLTQTRYFAEHFRTTDRSSGLVRYQIWRTSWQMIRDHPIFGIGPNNFEPVYRQTVPPLFWPPLEWLVAQPHNLFLALWLETGALGLIAFLGLVGTWLGRLWFSLKHRQGWMRAVALGSLAAMIALLVHGLFDTPYFKNDLALEFVLILLWPWLGSRATA